MTAAVLWQDIGAGKNIFTSLLRLAFLLTVGVVFYIFWVVAVDGPGA
jgi:flagellar basal body-associated protein FliL